MSIGKPVRLVANRRQCNWSRIDASAIGYDTKRLSVSLQDVRLLGHRCCDAIAKDNSLWDEIYFECRRGAF